MDFNINQLLNSLSYTLDFVEKDLIQNVTNHGRRVAYIAARIGRKINMADTDLFDLISYSLLHDNGVTKSLVQSQESGNYIKAELNRLHCVEGERNIAYFPFFHNIPNVILYHHEHYDGSGFFGVSGQDIPAFSRIIALADFIAIAFSEGESAEEILLSVKDSTYFDLEYCKVFYALSRNVEFWLNMNDNFVFGALNSIMPSVQREFSYKDMRMVSRIFSNIIDAKSPFTGSHSRGISKKTGILCQYYGFDEEIYWKMRIAADLHDLGKLMVPNDILDKPGTLGREEIMVIRSHPFYTRKTLEGMAGFEEIAEWASNHHEKLDGHGYPFGLDGSRLDFNSRLLGCVDIYQALTENRPYRKAMSHEKAITLMRTMVKNNLIDGSIVEDINSVFHALPVNV
ncbi:HD-GYP domain-containing protein [Caproiciproducens galactitolivorans]|uniref:HD domain-containing protein n=1 Tax=Caproiciproducens galactitolivorans TaxID=642589 RepID=A0ABT4BST5_9FIRM|nr:HD domain-containing phosphohydrolase [Caproiciproducens galactitolivorans]MCY1712993.1 HD domain-containing protein [Caproiciproducens galactitolivorans]